MTQSNVNARPVSLLLKALEAERDALKSGRFDQLAALADLITGLTLELQNEPGATRPEDLRMIRDHAARNARLLTAAQDGIAAARQFMTDVMTGNAATQTYDKAGKVSSIRAPHNRLEQRR